MDIALDPQVVKQ